LAAIRAVAGFTTRDDGERAPGQPQRGPVSRNVTREPVALYQPMRERRSSAFTRFSCRSVGTARPKTSKTKTSLLPTRVEEHVETSERSPVDDALDGLTTEQLLGLWDRLGPVPKEPEH
jgi:hypothetical protein